MRTWAEVDDRAARVAGALAAAGLGHDVAKVGLYLYNGPEYLEAQLGILKGRGVPVNINYRYRDQELVYLLENSDAEALVFHSSLADRVERVAAQLGALQAARPGARRRQPARRRRRRLRGRSSPGRPDAAHRPARPRTSSCSTRAARPACPRA